MDEPFRQDVYTIWYGDWRFRIPRLITPRHYSLDLDPRLEEGTFTGRVSIAVTAGETVKQVALDCEGLEISSAEIDGIPAAVKQSHDRITLTPNAPLSPGEATIGVAFRGTLGNTAPGLYRIGDCAVTQLQPTHARMLFPCFDAPGLKATFDVTVTAANGHSVLSNAPSIRDEPLGERHRVTFATSPRMPAYLLGIAIGAFDSIGAEDEGTRIRVHAGQVVRHGDFALEAARQFLRFYNGWLDTPYGLEKLDLVAVPSFDPVGMENTGAIFFRDTAVLIDPARAPAVTQRNAANLIAHELAHHWFGSLVTPASWDDLWLNEGFATWIAPKAVASWNAALTLDVEELRAVRSAMAADSLASSRAMRAVATTPQAIKELFDPISYRKGAAILRMFESWLGEETFRRGVNLYVQRHAHGTATSADLWNALSEVSGLDVAVVAVPFASAPGVPQLELSWGGDVVRIAQAGAQVRSIPMSIKVGFGDGRVDVHRLLLTSADAEVRMPGAVQWVFGNAGAAGYYRCLHANADAIPAAQLSAAEQATLLEDTWDAVWNGSSDTLAYLRVARDSLERHGTSPGLPAHLRELRELLATGARGPQFDAWLVRHAGSAGGDEALALLGFAGEANAVTRSRALTNGWLDGAAADEAFLDAAAVVAARHGDGPLFDRLLAALASGVHDTARLLRTIAAFESPACVEAQMAVMHHPRLAETDLLPYVEDLLANTATRVPAWSFLKENWDELGPKVISFGGRGAILSLGAFSDAGARADIASFFRGRNVAGAERALLQTLERIEGRIRFREKEQRRFDAWLLRQSAPATEASEPLQRAHHLLNTLAAGFHGALYQRVLFDRMGVAAPAWMHPPDDLRSAVSGLEGLWLQLFRGVMRVDAAVLQLAARLSEDLGATAQLASAAVERLTKSADAESATIVSILLAREVATRERILDGRLAFAALFGNEEEANRWRALLRSSATDADRSRRWLQRVGQTGLGRTLRLELANDAASLSGIFRSQAADVAALMAERESRPSP